MKLSITTAWNETAAFVKQEAGALFLIAFGLTVLPGLIVQAVAGRLVGPSLQFTPNTPPDFRPFLAAFPLILLMLIPLLVLSIWGHLTINTLALRRETVIGNAFSHAARRILPMLGAWLLWIVAACIVLVPVFALIIGAARSGHGGLAFLVGVLAWLAFVLVAIRLLLVTPVAAAETVGPIGILRRSWDLTGNHFWKLLGFLLLMILVFIVLAIVIGAVIGILVALMVGMPAPGSIGSFVVQFVTGVLQAIFITYFIVLIARIYAQLSGNDGSVGRVFE
jgi:hypothetical protein